MRHKLTAVLANVAVCAIYAGFFYGEWLLYRRIPSPVQLLLCAVMIAFTYFVAAPLWMKTFPKKRNQALYLMLGIVLILCFAWDMLRTLYNGNVFSLEVFMVPIVLALLFFTVKESFIVLFLSVVISAVNALAHLPHVRPDSVFSGLLRIGLCVLIIVIMDQALKVRVRLINKQHILVENSSALIIGIDRNGKIDLCNPAMCRRLNMKRNEIVDHFFWEVGTRAEADDTGQIFQLLAQRKKIEQLELHLKDDTQTATFLADTYPVDDDGLASGFIVVLNDITERKESEKKLYDLSVTDELTQIANRRHFENRLKEEIARSNRYGHPLSFMLIDLDHFKQLNDTYGHLFGDRVLQTVASVLKKHVRETDLVARWGGEEFAILMPETELQEAEGIGVRLLNKVSGTGISVEDGGNVDVNITFSAGVACQIKDVIAERLIATADAALYESKQNGRNRITVSASEAAL